MKDCNNNNKKIFSTSGTVRIFYCSFFIGSAYLQCTKKQKPNICALPIIKIIVPHITLCVETQFFFSNGWLAFVWIIGPLTSISADFSWQNH